MDDIAPRTARLLGYAGLIPFGLLVACAIVGVGGPIETLLVGYALAILSFLCGSLWMGVVQAEDAESTTLIVSNALLLAGLPALLLPLPAACVLLTVLFGIEAVIEWRRLGAALPMWYRRLRAVLSSTVIALLLLAAIAGAHHG